MAVRSERLFQFQKVYPITDRIATTVIRPSKNCVALNASPAEISQFKEITSAVSDVRSGVPLESVQADLVASLDELGEEQDDSEEGLYAHLDDDTRIARLESDRVFGAEDEPSHIAPENELGGDQVDD